MVPKAECLQRREDLSQAGSCFPNQQLSGWTGWLLRPLPDGGLKVLRTTPRSAFGRGIRWSKS